VTASRAVDVVVLNGGSSSGKSTIARTLQRLLPPVWLCFSIDDLVDAMPPDDGSITFGADGWVGLGEHFPAAEQAWYRGLAAMAAADGPGLLVDDVFLGGARSQQRVAAGLASLRVLWVGVRCDPDVAVERERARGDRPAGMARTQAEAVHIGVHYDLEVDSTSSSPADCAKLIAARC
jgi:chloramphenicol 3-O phosphotransferase